MECRLIWPRCRGPSQSVRRRVTRATLKRNEFRFAPPLNKSPFVPAEAGTQGPRTRPKNWVPASAGTNGNKFKLSSSRSAALNDVAAKAQLRLRWGDAQAAGALG